MAGHLHNQIRLPALEGGLYALRIMPFYCISLARDLPVKTACDGLSLS